MHASYLFDPSIISASATPAVTWFELTEVIMSVALR